MKQRTKGIIVMSAISWLIVVALGWGGIAIDLLFNPWLKEQEFAWGMLLTSKHGLPMCYNHYPLAVIAGIAVVATVAAPIIGWVNRDTQD